jgi:hypothetical protein
MMMAWDDFCKSTLMTVSEPVETPVRTERQVNQLHSELACRIAYTHTHELVSCMLTVS